MSATVRLGEPDQITAGDTIQWRRSEPDYLPGDGWTLTYTLVKANRQVDFSSADNGDGTHLINGAASTSANSLASRQVCPAVQAGTGRPETARQQERPRLGKREVYGMRLRDLLRKPKPAKKRRFDGAKLGRLTNDWVNTPRLIATEIRTDGQRLITRSRDLAFNDDYARRFLSVAKANIVGPSGVNVQSRVTLRDGRPDERAISGIEGDGEIVAVWVRDDDVPGGLSIQILDPLTLDHTYCEDLGRGRVVTNGVEHDEAFRPIAYWFRDVDPHGPTYIAAAKPRRRVEADRVMHVYLREEQRQMRGIPAMVSAMLRLQQLKGYEEAELVGARVGASKMGVLQRNADGIGYEGDDVSDDGEVFMEASPGSFAQLPEGVEFKPWDPTHPTSAYADYVKSVLRGAASGLGVSYNALANDLEGVNFSSIRAGVLEDREQWKALQGVLIDGFVRPCYERVISGALLRGEALAMGATGPGAPLPFEQVDRFTVASYIGRRWSWVDPQKDMAAAKEAHAINTRSVSSIIRETGADPEDVWQEIARDRERMTQLGLQLSQVEEDVPDDPEP